MIIDTHAHLNADPLFEKRSEVIKRARASGVIAVFNNADSFASFTRIDELHREYPDFCYGVYGLHPEFALTNNLARLQKLIEERRREIKAIGEIGLDYHYPLTTVQKDQQKEVFIAQIALAEKYGWPIVIHSRDASQDTFDILTKYAGTLKVDLHCYSGSAEIAREYLKKIPQINFGIGGIITFKNARKLCQVVEEIPLTHLLTETDAPFLAPTPFRGQVNEPSYLSFITKKIAEIKKINIEETERVLLENAQRFYSI